VTSDGREVTPGSAAVDVHRRGAVTAKIEFDCERNDATVIEAVAKVAAAEIDNVALRAELARQLELISESRSRLATAQLEERRRIERDLHDGAQQRLLAIALQLQSAHVNGQTNVLREEVGRAVAELGLTVQELRDLAGGLQPAALAGGGLLAAVVDLAVRFPLNITYDVVDRRFPPSIEGAAWFVIAEATSNAVKHAAVEDVSITVSVEHSALRVVVADGGVGQAYPEGRGLQGLADRVSALRGCLRVSENQPHGTIVEAELPCVS
jgi:signal transduction histidine kinase